MNFNHNQQPLGNTSGGLLDQHLPVVGTSSSSINNNVLPLASINQQQVSSVTMNSTSSATATTTAGAITGATSAEEQQRNQFNAALRVMTQEPLQELQLFVNAIDDTNRLQSFGE